MKTQKIAGTPLEVSRIALGGAHLGGPRSADPLTEQDRTNAIRAIRSALDNGISFFDNANTYGRGKCEEALSAIWSEIPGLRHKVVVESKCGVRPAWESDGRAPQRYDSSYEHIIKSVEGSLRRLKTEYLDVLLLHRPDALVEPEEVARAFDELHASGKVRFFGVSNHIPAQIELLRRWVTQPIVINQVQLNILHSNLIDCWMLPNQNGPAPVLRDEGTLEYCRLHDITVQAWSPLAGGVLAGGETKTKDARIESAVEMVRIMAQRRT